MTSAGLLRNVIALARMMDVRPRYRFFLSRQTPDLFHSRFNVLFGSKMSTSYIPKGLKYSVEEDFSNLIDELTRDMNEQEIITFALSCTKMFNSETFLTSFAAIAKYQTASKFHRDAWRDEELQHPVAPIFINRDMLQNDMSEYEFEGIFGWQNVLEHKDDGLVLISSPKVTGGMCFNHSVIALASTKEDIAEGSMIGFIVNDSVGRDRIGNVNVHCFDGGPMRRSEASFLHTLPDLPAVANVETDEPFKGLFVTCGEPKNVVAHLEKQDNFNSRFVKAFATDCKWVKDQLVAEVCRGTWVLAKASPQTLVNAKISGCKMLYWRKALQALGEEFADIDAMFDESEVEEDLKQEESVL